MLLALKQLEQGPQESYILVQLWDSLCPLEELS